MDTHSPLTRGAILILAIMFFLMIFSAMGDTLTFDELAHIPAGFGYLVAQDYRLNAEHPPLAKLLAAAASWIVTRPTFPTNTEPWTRETKDQWAQWDQGTIFLYQTCLPAAVYPPMCNNADDIIFWARFPIILLTLGLGWLLFVWTKNRFGGLAGMVALMLYAFSPTILAHGRLVTTDLPAAFGFFIGIVSFLAFLNIPSWKNIFFAGIMFGIATLMKFSLVLLIPIYAILIILSVWARPRQKLGERISSFGQLAGKTIMIGLVGAFVIWGVYAITTLNYPLERNQADAKTLLHHTDLERDCAKNGDTQSCANLLQNNLNLMLLERPATRPLGQYLLGLLLTTRRAAGGNTTYFMGEIATEGWRSYFPLMYLFKEPLALHVLTLIAIVFAVWKVRQTPSNERRIHRIRAWVHDHMPVCAFLAVIAVYWMASVLSPLNIGVRHVLPTFPFIYILVAAKVSEWISWKKFSDTKTWLQFFKNVYTLYVAAIPKGLIVSFLLFWIALDSLLIFPYYLSSYNELAGGPSRGYWIAVDSNYDWGQDLRRLRDYMDRHNIPKITVKYFGGGNLTYYFGKDRFEEWWPTKGQPHGWFAISANEREGAFATPVKGYERKPEDSYDWLKNYQPVARAGYSIFIYKLP